VQLLTHGNDPLEWQNSHRLKDIDAVGKVKASEGPDLLIQGSTSLYPYLLAARLIDRLFVMTFPVVLGKGKRLFGEGTPQGALKLVNHDVSTTGVVIATYEPAGKVPTGSFQLAESTPAEIRRRERMKREG
jgi:dihydrofolate reductase